MTIPRRQCPSCGEAAECTGWEAQVLRDAHVPGNSGIPSGLEYSFRCAACRHTFRVLGNGQMLWSLVAIAGFAWFGYSMLRDALAPEHPLWVRTFVIGAVCASAAAVAGLQVAWRIHVRQSAPELRGE